MERVDYLFDKIINRKIFYLFSVLILFFLFQNFLIENIEKHLVFHENFSNKYLDYLIISSSFISSIYIFYICFFKEYKASFLQLSSSYFLLFIILFYYSKVDLYHWEYYKDSLIGWEYFWYLLAPILIFLLITFIINVWKFIKYNLPVGEKTRAPNYIVSDDPIIKITQDELNYKPIVDRLSTILLNEKHSKSISIGLVGPWGNGKSSILNFVKNNILKNKKNSPDEIIVVNFYPYLNNDETDIINEFFNSLSKQLVKYNGKLSNQILDYTQKLTGLYKDNNIVGFFDKHITKIESTAAKSFYEDINKRLVELDKKIIVFVDDLDRLNDKEILQVLKLIRNTADFVNTIFVVAMDKDYAISVLKSNNQILNSRFLDKFFQFEIYLPEIDTSILKKHFRDLLLLSELSKDPDFESKLDMALTDDTNLFNDYIKNLRDVKRIVNQIIFDYPFTGSEIDFKDFFNFTLFKLKFPSFMKLLNDNRLDYLEHDKSKDEFKLREAEDVDETKSEITKKDILREVSYFGSINFNDFKYLKDYELYNSLIAEDCLKNDLSIDCRDRILLLKSLVYLFGNKNIIKNTTSIRKVNNFRMLMQQRIFEDVLLENEFIHLIKNVDYLSRIKTLKTLKTQNKIGQLLNRLEYYNSDNEIEIENTILILIELYNYLGEYNIAEAQLLRLLAQNVQRKFDLNKEDSVSVSKWIKKNIFESKGLITKNKLLLFGKLWDSRLENKLWYLNEENPAYISSSVITLFKAYLKPLNGKLWDVNDFTFYQIYHSIKKIENVRESLHEIIINFWKKNEVELLCAQSTTSEPFSLKAFTLSDLLQEIFGSKKAFVDFIYSHKNKNEKSILEFIELYKLFEITAFTVPIIYSFKTSKKMLKKVELSKTYEGRSPYDEFKDWKQILIETNDTSILEEIIYQRNIRSEKNIIDQKYSIPITGIDTLDLLQFSTFSANNRKYLLVSYDKKYHPKYAELLIKAFIIIAKFINKDPSFSPKFNVERLSGKNKLALFKNKYVTIISKQP
ncbi:KAP family P-loop NTPase fold protein [Winogradskyella sediminis]|uniref:KAP family P-loop NTPase fold protein n=1 Tax=Winogradskyella sediminis TaxID=1382466 RepID=UPI003AA82638